MDGQGGSTRKSAEEEGRFVDFFLLAGGPGVAGRGKRVCELNPLVASPL